MYSKLYIEHLAIFDETENGSGWLKQKINGYAVCNEHA